MLDKDGKRMLAYVQEVLDVEPLYFTKDDPSCGKHAGDEADNIVKIHVLGWTLVTQRSEFKPGDKCVFFEIDSKIPANKFLREDGTDVFDFLARKNHCVKTYKLNKFGVHSQGLALPLSKLGLSNDLEINHDLTDELGIRYAIPEDNHRKSDRAKDQQKSYMAKHKKFFSNKLVKKLMRFKFFRWLFLLGMHKGKKDMKKAFPSEFVAKTDEERIQNMPFILADKQHFVATEKIDGTSTTWLLVRKGKNKFEFYVCSRNVRMFKPDQECFNGNDNIYWEMALKYDVENQMKKYLNEHKELKWVCIQGESFGEGWQSNRLKMCGHHFAAFNFKDSEHGRWGSVEARDLLMSWEKPIPWVPILDTDFVLPDTVEELLNIATDYSVVNNKCLREGIVFRSKDGQLSFKAVSPEYLEKYGE